MKRILLAALLFATPATADFAGCRADKALLEQMLSYEAPITTNRPLTREEDWCILHDLRAEERRGAFQVRVDTLRWRRTGLDAQTGAWPTTGSIELHAEGIRMQAITGSALVDYSQRIQSQSAASRFTLMLEFDAESKTVNLASADLELPNRNGIAITDARFTVGSTFTASPVALTQMRLEGLTLELESHGFFEATALFPILAAFVDLDEDPEPKIAALKKQARQQLKTLPADLMGGSSHQALNTLLDDLPNPWGKATIRIDAPNGFGAANLAPMAINPGADALNTVLSSLRLAVRYTRSPR